MKTSHTPGPWVANGFFVESASHGNVAMINLARASKADACLIAAAPDLLAVCQLALILSRNATSNQDRVLALGTICDAARAAIANAEGSV